MHRSHRRNSNVIDRGLKANLEPGHRVPLLCKLTSDVLLRVQALVASMYKYQELSDLDLKDTREYFQGTLCFVTSRYCHISSDHERWKSPGMKDFQFRAHHFE